ncbi:hypothetical protein I3842_14G130300 [Carya illinoinensis]|uniref:Uncharacterized protein n=1 Tax=Carya illinoinensis TaxID=32201 RepID=A0A922D4W8_CARIL|nr:hypothetical protein I3842_14G130300 [Carya illinoinensis]
MRDPTYDIGSLVDYQMEGKYSVQVVCIDFDSKGEKKFRHSMWICWEIIRQCDVYKWVEGELSMIAMASF